MATIGAGIGQALDEVPEVASIIHALEEHSRPALVPVPADGTFPRFGDLKDTLRTAAKQMEQHGRDNAAQAEDTIRKAQELLREAEARAVDAGSSSLRLLRDAEIKTVARLRDKLSSDLKPSAHIVAEYEYKDASGVTRTIDQMGSPKASQFWNEADFEESNIFHLRKANDFTAVDLTEFTPRQKGAISNFINSLPTTEQEKIIKVGF